MKEGWRFPGCKEPIWIGYPLFVTLVMYMFYLISHNKSLSWIVLNHFEERENETQESDQHPISSKCEFDVKCGSV